MALKPADIEALIALFGTSGWDEMRLEIDGEELFLSRDSRSRLTAAPAFAAPMPAPLPVAPPVAAATPATAAATAATPATTPAATPAPAAATAAATAAANVPATRPGHWVALKAANLGTYYRAPSAEAAPYVAVGTRVTAETEVCMIEVMKLFTTLRAGMAGTVSEICATDGQMVEFGQDLMWIEPA